MKRYKGILLSSTLLLSTSVFAAATNTTTTSTTNKATTAKTAPVKNKAATTKTTPPPPAKTAPSNKAVPQWEPHAMGGIATLNSGDINVDITSIETDRFVQSNANAWDSWTVTAGLGYIFPLHDALVYSKKVQWFTAVQPQLNAYYLQGDMDGKVDRFSNFEGDFNDTDYTIELKSTRLMLDASLTVMSWRRLSLYAIGGVGVSWNTLDLNSKANDCVESYGINDHDTNFVWEVGAGVTYAFTPHFALSFEYLFTEFENLQLGENAKLADGTELSDIKSSSFNLNSQALMLGLRTAF